MNFWWEKRKSNKNPVKNLKINVLSQKPQKKKKNLNFELTYLQNWGHKIHKSDMSYKLTTINTKSLRSMNFLQ